MAAATAFRDRHVVPHAAGWELDRRMPVDALQAAAHAGLLGLLVPPALGGLGLGAVGTARVLETLSYGCMAFAFSLVVHNNLAGAIARSGSPDQQRRYLPAMLAGDRIGAFLLTEPGVGSDATKIATTARRTGGGWVIDGAKAWVSNAAAAGVLAVYAQTDPAAGHRGIAAFLVDADAAGVVREPPYALMGGHALGTGGFRFEGVEVGDAQVLLPPGEGFRGAMAGIDLARAVVGAACAGMLQCGLDTAVGYTGGRQAFGQRIADFQGVRFQLADVATDLEAARALTYGAARAIDAGADATVAAAHAKKFATRAAVRGLATCMQVRGAAGFRHDMPLARHLACAKMAEWLDGATEIQNVVIARRLFG